MKSNLIPSGRFAWMAAALAFAALPACAQKNGITDTGKRRLLGRPLRRVCRNVRAEHVGNVEV